MFKIKPIAVSILVVIYSSITQSPTQAVYGGKPSVNNPYVVGIIGTATGKMAGCTGALVAPRIVYTAAHCVGGFSEKMWVATPSANLLEAKTKRVEVEKIFVPDEFDSKKFPYSNDFSVFILKSPLVEEINLSVATLDQINKWTQEQSTVLHVGYGCTELVKTDDPFESCNPTSPFPYEFETTLTSNVPRQFETLTPGSFTMTKIEVNKTLCGGDSGSPLFKKTDEGLVYIGALSSSNGAGCTKSCDMNCVATQVPAASNQALIAKANEYLANQNESTKDNSELTPISPKEKKPSNLICVKGEKTKTVKGTGKKCPSGYKPKSR